MAIPPEFIEELKQNCDVERIISSYVNLKRRGRNLLGLCPFHSEKTPSFTVYPDSQSFYCFGCGAGGDVVTFIKKIENLEYVEALKFLADKNGIKFPENSVDDDLLRQKANILEINRCVARFYHDCLMSEKGRQAYDYLKNRGLSDKTIRRFGLGYSPNSWDETLKYLRSKGFKQEDLVAAALISKGRNNSNYDTFRNRVMFPIIDLRGNVIGFGGRALEDKGPKYLNSADTPVFKKSKNLFSLNFAKTVKDPKLILAEGYMDVISVHQAGFANTVATLGTSLTPEQARLISQYCEEVLIAYDSDGAGQQATKRAVGLLNETGVKVRILSYEGAKDPDEYIKKFGPARFKLLLEGSSNATEFALNKAKNDNNILNEDGKLAYLNRAVAILADVNSPIERDIYATKIATEVNVGKDAILTMVQSLVKRKMKERHKKEEREISVVKIKHSDYNDKEREANLRAAQAEEGIIAVLYKNQDFLSFVKEKIMVSDFITSLNRKIFDIILLRLSNNSSIETIALGSLLNEQEMARYSLIIASSSGVKYNKEDLLEYITVLKECKNTPAKQDIINMSEQEVNEYIKSLAAKQK